MKEEPKYKMLQLPEEVHALLKNYCKKNNMIMSAYVSSLIRKGIKK
jgi:sialic acid synthase SpsE